MKPDALIRELLQGSKILRPPKHMLSTFGSTTLRYVILSPLPADENICRLREGQVTAQRPQILTPDLWQKRFEGFGDESDHFKDWFERAYGENFRALEYTFKNELQTTSVEHANLAELTDRTLKAFNEEDSPRKALLQGPDSAWHFSVMKFIVEMSMRSFPGNMRELDERGFFDSPEQRESTRHRARIEALFQEAIRDRNAVSKLGQYLKEAGLFGEYEDRFFALLSNR